MDQRAFRLASLGEMYARWGKKQEALETIRRLRRMSRQSYVAPNMIALIYSRLGKKDAAITLLEKAKPEDDPKISDPAFESLRSELRFKKLEARLKANPSCPAL